MKPIVREAVHFAGPSVPLLVLALLLWLGGPSRPRLRELFPSRSDTWVNGGLRLLGTTDATGDGKADAILFDFTSGTLTVVSAPARSGRPNVTPTLVGPGPIAAATLARADLDARPDLIQLVKRRFSNGSKVSLVIYSGTGLGFSASPVTVTDDVPKPDSVSDVAAACLDADERPDLLVSTRGSTFTAYLAQRDGTWLARPVPLGHTSGQFVLADLDGDGIVDLATADTTQGGVTIHYGVGDGTFSAGMHTPVAGVLNQLVARDVDGDQRVDLVTISSLQVALLKNMSARSFTASAVTSSSRNVGTTLAIVDVDRDGLLDVVAAGPGGRELNVMLQQQGGTFEPVQRVATRDPPSGIEVGDLDGDGSDEVIAVGTSGTFTIFHGR